MAHPPDPTRTPPSALCRPPKLETLVACPLAEAQLFWYRRLLLKDSSVLSTVEQGAAAGGTVGEGGTKYKSLMNLLMQLRKCCDPPFLFAGAEEDPDETSLEELVRGGLGSPSPSTLPLTLTLTLTLALTLTL